jgi:hypothetical protein
MKGTKKLLTCLCFLAVTGCSAHGPVGLKNDLITTGSSDDFSYNTQALSVSYEARKLNSFKSNGREILEELKYGQLKHPVLIKDAINEINGAQEINILDSITVLPEVSTFRQQSQPFSQFLDYLRQESFIISTIAGTGENGFDGDGGDAVNALLGTPERIAIDKSGNIYFGDYDAKRVRKIGSDGKINTFAGGGNPQDGIGDGGSALEANLRPGGINFDPDGNLFIADQDHHTIRKIDTAGNISTFAGGGTPQDDVGNDGPAVNAKFGFVYSLAIDSKGNVFVFDRNNLRKIDNETGNITNFLSEIAPSTDSGMAFDHSDNLFIADYDNNVIKKIDTNGNISVYAGTGALGYDGDGDLATKAEFNNTWNIAFDNEDNIYLTASSEEKVRRIDRGTGIITKIAGTGNTCDPTTDPCGDGGNALSASFNYPAGMVFDKFDNMYLADSSNHRIRKITH